jgi:N-acyl-D-aspartate/D-glutamate deacylase
VEAHYDLVIKSGRVFDGAAGPARIAHVGIRNGLVVEVSTDPLDERGAELIDAAGRWVMPGFIDTHTHYDAELVAAPGLSESVRHGVTTVLTGSCSLSMVHGDPVDSADLFSRVEALPYEPVLEILQKRKQWSDARGWVQQLHDSPLGPNVASMLGHSDVRAHVMGLDRATTPGERPSKTETQRMVARLEDALDAGFLGFSTMTNPWDKLAGTRYRSRSLPSTYATWREYGAFHRVLRERDRVLQSAPNLNTKINIFAFYAVSAALPWRKALKTSLISAADPKASPWLASLFSGVSHRLNRLLRAKLTWQTVPGPFEIYADGIDLVVFEEFGAGAAAMHLADEVERNQLLASEAYRRRFRADFEKKFSPRIWHRDFYDATIVGCPEAALVGKSVGQVADDRGLDVCDVFLDLVVAHGKAFRWKTVLANHRPEVLAKILAQPDVHVAFADSGAHLRNMAFYNFPLRFLKKVKDADDAGTPFMTLERAVHKLTGELADWYGIDAGSLAKGDRADIAIIDPAGLDDAVHAYHETDMPEMGLSRMVCRNDAAVRATIIGGRVVFESGVFTSDYGTRRYGRFLAAGETNREPIAAASASIGSPKLAQSA